MVERIYSLLTALGIAFVLALAIVPLAHRLARRYRIMAIPGAESRHTQPTAMLGGVAIAGALLGALALAGNLPPWLLFATVVLTAMGLVDDLSALLPAQKLAAQIAVTLAVIWFGPRFVISHHPTLDALLVFLWLVGTTNAFNLIDGLDGLAAGIGAVTGLAVAVTAALYNNMALAGWAMALSGALFGFLVYNLHPASIFMGDAGALPVGFLLGVFALQAGSRSTNSRLTAFVFPALVMLVPLLDTAIVSATRLATGRPISRRGLDHTHHRLLSLGLSDRSVAMVCWGASLLAASCAVGASVVPHPYLIVALPFVLLPPALVTLFMMDLTFDSLAPGIAYGSMPRIARVALRAAYKLRLVEASLDVFLIAAAYFAAFLIRLDFAISPWHGELLLRSLPWVLAATYPAFAITGVYRGMWRYTGLADAVRFANGAVAAGLCLLVVSRFVPLGLSGSILVLFIILLFNLLVASRMSFRLLRKASARLAVPATRVLIVGAGRTGAVAAKQIEGWQDQQMCLFGFADDDVFKHGKLVAGVPVLGSLDDLDRIHARLAFNQILIATDKLQESRVDLICAFANAHNVAVRRFSLEVRDAAVMAVTGEATGELAAAGR